MTPYAWLAVIGLTGVFVVGLIYEALFDDHGTILTWIYLTLSLVVAAASSAMIMTGCASIWLVVIVTMIALAVFCPLPASSTTVEY
jgi:hypothetical protein